MYVCMHVCDCCIMKSIVNYKHFELNTFNIFFKIEMLIYYLLDSYIYEKEITNTSRYIKVAKLVLLIDDNTNSIFIHIYP